MTTQPEQLLEDNLVKQLQSLGYGFIALKDDNDLNTNLKAQLEKHNQITLTDKEFAKVLSKPFTGAIKRIKSSASWKPLPKTS